LKKSAGKITFAVIASLVLLAGFQVLVHSKDEDKPKGKAKTTSAPMAEITKAVAVLHPTEGAKVHGVVTFTQAGDKVKVVAHVEGLTPGKHGFHLHEWGDCRSKDGMATGGHFNPTAMPHAAPDAAERHHGDLGNIEANQSGVAQVEFTDPVMKFDGPNSILGRGVVVHAQPDDLKSQPAGAAGARLACGVIGVAKP
jgi:Cu-Zn family superoxide dismutase